MPNNLNNSSLEQFVENWHTCPNCFQSLFDDSNCYDAHCLFCTVVSNNYFVEKNNYALYYYKNFNFKYDFINHSIKISNDRNNSIIYEDYLNIGNVKSFIKYCSNFIKLLGFV